MIKVEGVSYTYGKANTAALRDISVEIKKGNFWGLIGPNGAGKTTLLSILSGIMNPSGGAVFYQEQNFAEKRKNLLKKIGVVPQEYSLYSTLTPVENLMFFGSIYGVQRKELEKRIETGLERLDMTEHAHKKVHQLSGGMKRRINLLAGVIHQPEVLFLDEPTVGVDIQSKDILVQFIREMNQNGTTIIYTSHHLQEAQELCTHLAFINRGKIIANQEVKNYFGQYPEANTIEEIYHQINA